MQRLQTTVEFKGFEIICGYIINDSFLDYLHIKILDKNQDVTAVVSREMFREVYEYCKTTIKEEL